MAAASPNRSRNGVSRPLYAMNGYAYLLSRVGFFGGFLGLVGVLIDVGVEKNLLALIAGGAFGLAIVSGLILVANRRRVTCPLCRVSLFLGHKSLVKRQRAKFILGSVKLPLAIAVGTGATTISCPYCAERVKLKRDDL